MAPISQRKKHDTNKYLDVANLLKTYLNAAHLKVIFHGKKDILPVRSFLNLSNIKILKKCIFRKLKRIRFKKFIEEDLLELCNMQTLTQI